MKILNHVYPFIADQGSPRRFVCLKGPVYVQPVHPFGCKMSEKWWKTESHFPIKWRRMPSPLSRQRQNNVTGYLKWFQLFSWIHVVFLFLLFCCEPLYWPEVQFSTLLRFLNQLRVWNQHHCTQLVWRGWLLSYDWRMHTHHPHPPTRLFVVL